MQLIAIVFAFVAMFGLVLADFHYAHMAEPNEHGAMERYKIKVSANNLKTGGPYTYSQSAHHFKGVGFDGSMIDTTKACCGQSGSCRNNPSCQCQVSVGPLPQGQYSLGDMMTFKGMPYCYVLYPDSSNNMCGRSGFLIHGGGCSANPSEGCIIIEDPDTRYLIKSGSRLTVTK